MYAMSPKIKRETPLQLEILGKDGSEGLAVNGDGNSRFFQNRANARRKRKLLIKIKDERVWVFGLKIKK